jgi:hypothetical protein
VWAMMCTDPADPYCGPPERAIDGITTNRFSTGQARSGAEWLDIDFKQNVAVNKVVINTAAGSSDYTLAYEVRMAADETAVATAPVIVSGTGMMGATTITFPMIKTGKVMRITQKMAMAGWWSVQEVDVSCQ